MGRFLDYYAILNVPADASAEAIGAAHGARLAEVGDLPPGEREERLALLQRAIHVLGDEGRRIAYDVSGEGGVVDEPEPGAATLLRPEEPEDYCAILGVGRDATKTEIEEAYFTSVAALGSLKGAGVRASDMAERSEALYRAYRALSSEKREKVVPVPFKTTAIFGGLFALLLATAWTLQLSSAVLRLTPDIPTPTPFENFLAAVAQTNHVFLWTFLFVGSLALWFFTLGFMAGLTTVIQERMIPFGSPRSPLKRDSSPLVMTIFLVVATPVFLTYLLVEARQIEAAMFFLGDPVLVVGFYSCLLPLVVTAVMERHNLVRVIVLQTSFVLGHLLLLLATAHFVLGRPEYRIYGSGGLAQFGFPSWWLAFYTCCRGREYLAKRELEFHGG